MRWPPIRHDGRLHHEREVVSTKVSPRAHAREVHVNSGAMTAGLLGKWILHTNESAAISLGEQRFLKVKSRDFGFGMDGPNEVNGNEYIVVNGEVEMWCVIGQGERCSVRGGDAIWALTPSKEVFDDQSGGHNEYNEQEEEGEASAFTLRRNAGSRASAEHEMWAINACALGRGEGRLEGVPRRRQTECFRGGGGGIGARSFTFSR